MTILDACVEVLKTADQAMTARQLLEEIKQRQLFKFGAKDPLTVLSGTLRKNLREGSSARIREVTRGLYRLA